MYVSRIRSKVRSCDDEDYWVPDPVIPSVLERELEIRDTGLLDVNGVPIMFVEDPRPIGFIWNECYK